MRNPLRRRNAQSSAAATTVVDISAAARRRHNRPVTTMDEPESYLPVAHTTAAQPVRPGDLELAITAMLTEATPALDGMNPDFLDQWVKTRTPLHNATVDDEVPGRVRTAARLLAISDAALVKAANELQAVARRHQEVAAEEIRQQAALLGQRVIAAPTTQSTEIRLIPQLNLGSGLLSSDDLQHLLTDALDTNGRQKEVNAMEKNPEIKGRPDPLEKRPVEQPDVTRSRQGRAQRGYEEVAPCNTHARPDHA